MISPAMILWTAWNLFLAALPVPLGLAMLAAIRKNQARPSATGWMIAGSAACAWLAFLPNSCYLLTEWRHFLFNGFFQEARNLDNPLTFSVYRVARHVAFYAAYSGFGMLCFAISARHGARAARLLGLRPAALAAPFFLAVALGVYLGLVVRFNSWDLVARPVEVVLVAVRAMLMPRLIVWVTGLAIALAAFYLAFDIWVDGLAMRLRSLRPIPIESA